MALLIIPMSRQHPCRERFINLSDTINPFDTARHGFRLAIPSISQQLSDTARTHRLALSARGASGVRRDHALDQDHHGNDHHDYHCLPSGEEQPGQRASSSCPLRISAGAIRYCARCRIGHDPATRAATDRDRRSHCADHRATRASAARRANPFSAA